MTAPTAAETFGIPSHKACEGDARKPATTSPWVGKAAARTLPPRSYDRFAPASFAQHGQRRGETLNDILRRTLPSSDEAR